MSGTLFPAEMYADLLGISAGRRVLRTYASPFPRENRLLLVSPNVTTLFVKRGREMHDAIAREIGGISSVVPARSGASPPWCPATSPPSSRRTSSSRSSYDGKK